MPDASLAPSPFLLRFGVEDWFVQDLRESFPDIEFIVSDPSGPEPELPRATAALCWNLKPEHLQRAANLRWAHWIGAGVDAAPLSDLRDRRIILTNSSGIHAINMAEHLMSMMLAFTRGLPNLVRAQDRHDWIDAEARSAAGELFGSNLLIIGAGAIGTELARRAQVFGMNVVAVGRTARRIVELDLDVQEVADIESFLPEADHVALALPGTPETHLLLNERRLNLMKPSSYLYNVGRGTAVDTSALIVGLRSGHIAGAGLDVIDPEPLPQESPLWDMPNVLITAHTAGATPHYWRRLLDLLKDNLERYQTGHPLRNVVNFEIGY